MVSRRQFLTMGAGGLASVTLASQTPKRGGTLSPRSESERGAEGYVARGEIEAAHTVRTFSRTAYQQGR
jgi:hypothetical protein